MHTINYLEDIMIENINELVPYSQISNTRFRMGPISFVVNKDIMFFQQFADYFLQYSYRVSTTYSQMHRRYSSVSSFLNDFYDDLDKILAKPINDAVEILVKFGLYNATKNQVYAELQNFREYQEIDDIYDIIEHRYAQISQTYNAERKYREMRKNNRSKVIGGGFGISGAIKGMAMAGAINMTTGAIHGAVNIVGNISSELNRSSSENSLLNNKAIIKNLSYAIANLIDCLPGIIYRVITKKRSIPSSDNADRIFENLLKYNPTGDKRLEMYSQLFSEFPFDDDYYVQFFKDYGDEGGSVGRIAKRFDCDDALNEEKCASYIKLCNNIQSLGVPLIDTENRIRQILNKLGIYSDTYVNDEVYEYVKNIKIRSMNDLSFANIVSMNRTADGKIYDSPEEAAAVRKEAALAESLMQNVNKESLSDVRACKEKISELRITNKEEYIKKLEEYDVALRTVNGVVFENLSDKMNAEQELKASKDYISTTYKDLDFKNYTPPAYKQIEYALSDVRRKFNNMADNSFISKCKAYITEYNRISRLSIISVILYMILSIALTVGFIVLLIKVLSLHFFLRIIVILVIIILIIRFMYEVGSSICDIFKVTKFKKYQNNLSQNVESNESTNDNNQPNIIQTVTPQEISTNDDPNKQAKQKSGRIDFR